MTVKWEGTWDWHSDSYVYAWAYTDHGKYEVYTDQYYGTPDTKYALEFTAGAFEYPNEDDFERLGITPELITQEPTLQDCFSFAEEHMLMQKLAA